MKITRWIIIALVLSIPFGAVPLRTLALVLRAIAIAVDWIGRGIDIFGWGGILDGVLVFGGVI